MTGTPFLAFLTFLTFLALVPPEKSSGLPCHGWVARLPRLRGHEPKPDGTNQTIEQAACLFSSKVTA